MDRVEGRLTVHETGTTATWHEPSVIRGDVGPDEKKPPDQPDQPAWKDQENPAAAAMAPMLETMAAVAASVRAAQGQVVYRMVRRTMACPDDATLAAAVTHARRASRVLDGLLKRGAVPEAQCGHHHGLEVQMGHPQIMMLGRGPRPDGEEPPRPKAPRRKRPRRKK